MSRTVYAIFFFDQCAFYFTILLVFFSQKRLFFVFFSSQKRLFALKILIMCILYKKKNPFDYKCMSFHCIPIIKLEMYTNNIHERK